MANWVSIPGYEGVYEISDEGGVVRTGFSIRTPLRPHRRSRYLAFDLSKDNERHRDYAHRLVWLSFRGPIPEGLEINHLDGNRENNCLDNLELATRSRNMAHCYQHLNPSLNRVRGVKHHKAKLTPDIVREIRQMRSAGIGCKKIADAFGVSKNAIRLIDIGKNWAHVA